ncbi:hypothetical protein SCHPADRAFT_840026 [Schizopora paradoxa]|uniref:Core domain-containing protein n=1 Tax=Schizopora paradoxa TaxID=27342 RepID=A0A0H2R0X6_9AGAM|nr:hypothetical protein SCHPADRAFT_840026 [Schizopora paradoxa]
MPLPRQSTLVPLRAFVRSSASRQQCLKGIANIKASSPPDNLNSRRAFSSSIVRGASALADHSSRQQAGPKSTRSSRLLHSPSERDLQEAEIEAEVLPVHEATFQMTDAAAQQLQAISGRDNNPNTALRIVVESGGCHGYQYRMELTSKRELDDYHFEHPSLKPSNIYIDAISMPLVKGSTLDFATELIGSSFRIAENPQAKGSGCGCGVSWELKV